MSIIDNVDIPEALLARPDIAAQIICGQIDNDHQDFIRRSVISNMQNPGNMNWRDIRVIAHINRLPDGGTPARLSELTRFNPATIMRVNLKLIGAGLVRLEDHTHDARSSMVVIEPAGRLFMADFLSTYERICSEIIPGTMTKLTEDDVQILTQACMVLHERAERLAGLDLSGRQKGYNTTSFAQTSIKMKYGMDIYHPGLVFQLLCRRISRDYLVFLKRHAVIKLTSDPIIKIRELRVIMCLEYFGKPTAPHKIAKLMRYDPATVTRALTILSRDGYVQSIDSSDDEREKPVWITDKGRIAADEYKTVSWDALRAADEITGHILSEAQIRQCSAALLVLRDRSYVFSNYRKGGQRRSARL